MLGSHIAGRYRLDAELGRGGMGVVYQAQDTILKRDVAVKLLAAADIGTEGRARLMNEARAVASLNHPNIVAIHDAGESAAKTEIGDPIPYIVMELLDGRTLHDRRPISLDETVAVARQLCAALGHAHAHGIIHRDLKPENVMLVGDATVKLMDFGLARSLTTRMTAEGTLMGTLYYMAPEVVMGEEVDGRTDLYAVGIMLYEMLVGRLPFHADDPVAVLTQHLHAPIVPPSAHNAELPPGLDQLIISLMAKEPGRRPGSAADVVAALDELNHPRFRAGEFRSLSTLDRIVRGRLVGRAQELVEARAMWGQAASGRGQVLLISGEPGIGKTRLVDELITQARVSGGRVLSGASYAEGGSPYAPFRQMLREALNENTPAAGFDLPGDVLADVLTLVPEFRPRNSQPLERTPGDPLEEQRRLLDNIALFFNLLSNQAPLLLVLEDAHWADSGTISLMRHLARSCAYQPLMITLTYREVEIDEARALHEALQDLRRERLARRLKLARLDKEGTRALLATLFDEEITPDFLDSIYRETEGNPFFIEEIAKALVESGQLTFKDGRWHRPPIEELGVPQSIRLAIQARARALSEPSRKIVEQAAVLGRVFDLPTLALATEQDEETLLEALDEALAAQLIEEVSDEDRGLGERFSFLHALIPASLAAGLRTLQRRRLQRRAAAALETLHAHDYEVLAFHFIEAGQIDQGVHYLLQAGDRARAQYAHEEAIDSYREAIEHLKEQDDLEQAARALMKLGLAYNNAFQFAQSRQAYREGFALWQQTSRSPSSATPQAAPHALRVPWGEPASLDPGMSNDVPSSVYIEQLFSGLVQLTAELDVVPDVAHGWEVLDGGRSYRFYLRDEVTWSDGVQVTASDFAFAWRRVLASETNSINALSLFTIKNGRHFHEGSLKKWDDVGVDVIDKLTLEVTLENPDSTFLYQMSQPFAFAVPQHRLPALETSSSGGAPWMAWQELVTNGPFTLAAWEPGQNLLLEAYPGYHGRRSGNVRSVDVRIYPFDHEDSERLADYEADRLDMTIPPRIHAIQARNHFAADHLLLPELQTNYLGFDTRTAPFADLRLRRALALATDRERLSEAVSDGLDIPASGGFVPPGMPGHAEGIALPYDPEEARRLLAEAGYGEGRDFPRVEFVHTPWNAPTAHYLAERWRALLGIEIKTVQLPWAVFLERLEADLPPIYLMGWRAGFPDPDDFLRLSEAYVRAGWRRETYERLVERAREMMDQAGRLALYRQAEEILVEEAPIIPISYGQSSILIKPWVRRFPTSPIQFWYWKDVVIEPH